jgi:hypothetical protein
MARVIMEFTICHGLVHPIVDNSMLSSVSGSRLVANHSLMVPSAELPLPNTVHKLYDHLAFGSISTCSCLGIVSDTPKYTIIIFSIYRYILLPV